MNSKRASTETNISDDGYGSDRPKSPENNRIYEIDFQLQNQEFKEKYLVEKLLNNSANGVIYSGFRKSDSMPVVVKQIPKSRISKFENVGGRNIPSEIYFHMTASGAPGVVKALEFFERRTSWVLIMEKPTNSIDLFEFSSQFGALSEGAAKIIFRQVVESCIHLKSRGVFHRDLKDENILLDIKTLETKIIDFGCATDHEDREYTELTGTPEFCCPEYYTVSQYKPESSTIWTLGTFLYVLLFGDIPYENKTDIIRGTRTKYDESKLSPTARDLLQSLLSMRPSKRPTLEGVLNSEWLNGC